MSTSLCLHHANELFFLDKQQPLLDKQQLLYIALILPLENKHKLRKLPSQFAKDDKMQQLPPKQSFTFQGYL